MTDAEKYNYAAPVAQLFSLGETGTFEVEDWPNYLERGLSVEHIPDLIHMATREELNTIGAVVDARPEVLAPMHAWRALGQLHAEAAIDPLLSLFEFESEERGNETVIEELPEVYGLIGPGALPALATFLTDRSHSEVARSIAADCIVRIAQISPEKRPAAIEILSKQLAAFRQTGAEFNASLIDALVRLEAKEAAPLMEAAINADAADGFLTSGWDLIQVRLGLLSSEEAERRWPASVESSLPPLPSFNPVATPSDTYWRQTPRSPAEKKARHKKKMSQQARKKNRKR